MKFVSKLDGPFLKFYGSYLAQNFDEELECNVHELGIVMEFCPVSLISKIQKMRINKQEFSEQEFEEVARLLIDGFSMLSESTMKIYHQDVKPQNIFFDSEGNLKIGDFNISTMDHLRDCTQTTGMNAVQGTVAYMAPEIIAVLNEGRGRYRKSKADVYSFGVTLLQMYTKENQTYNESRQRNQREKKINDIKYPWLKNLIKVSLNEDYKLRPSFKDLFGFLPGMATIV
jgi:serine/threonine protein kinase